MAMGDSRLRHQRLCWWSHLLTTFYMCIRIYDFMIASKIRSLGAYCETLVPQKVMTCPECLFEISPLPFTECYDGRVTHNRLTLYDDAFYDLMTARPYYRWELHCSDT